MWQGKEIALKGGDKIIPVRGNDVAAQKVSSATAAKDAARESNTVKGAAAVAVGSATYAATNMQTVLENPSLTFLIGLALGLSITGMFIIWKKFKDRD
jgi:Flp pilus assembly protein TadB